jgi:hypothetical protein
MQPNASRVLWLTSSGIAAAPAEKHRLWSNHVRPHSSLEYQTPVQFAITCMEKNVTFAAAQPRPSTSPRVLDTETNLFTALP